MLLQAPEHIRHYLKGGRCRQDENNRHLAMRR